MWIALLRRPDFDTTDLSQLRKGYYGASPMPVEVLKEIQRRLPDVSCGTSTARPRWRRWRRSSARTSSSARRLGRAGRRSTSRPGSSTTTASPCRPARSARSCTAARTPTLGYCHDQAKTAEAFRGGWFHSGDLGVIDDDGYLYVVDRKKDMIKTGGENVASREVEEAIYSSTASPRSRSSGSATRAGSRRSPPSSSPSRASTLTADDVHRAHAASGSPRYKAPKYVVIVDALPKNPSGKILKRELRERYADLAQTPRA